MSNLQILRNLEAKYNEALKHVRALIEMESGPVAALVQPEIPIVRHSVSAVPSSFADLTKGDAAAYVFQESNTPALHKVRIFEKMREKGHPVKDVNSIVQTLSADKRFKSHGNGLWSLQPVVAS